MIPQQRGCCETGCSNPYYARDRCSRHYDRLRRQTKPMSPHCSTQEKERRKAQAYRDYPSLRMGTEEWVEVLKDDTIFVAILRTMAGLTARGR